MILTYISLFVVISAFIDWEHLSSNQYIDSHISRGVLRFLFILAVSRDITDFLGMSIFFMATFDGVLNWMRGKDLFYLGTVAYWDRFWSKIPFLFMAFKVVCLFVGIYLLLI